MFRKENGIDIIQLGTGDILVSNVRYPNHKNIVGVGFSEIEPMPIGSFNTDLEGKTESEVNIKYKLDFTSIKSIQVVIDRLREAQETLRNGLNV